MSKKKKRKSNYRDTTSTPVFHRPKNAIHGVKRYYIITQLRPDNTISIELSASRQATLLKVKDGAKVISIKSLKFKNRINDVKQQYVNQYQNASQDIFEKLDNIVI